MQLIKKLMRAEKIISACLSTILLMVAGAAPGIGAPLIGLSLNLPKGGTVYDLGKITAQERSDGVRLMYISAKWRDLEPSPGQYNFKVLNDLSNISAQGFKIAFTIQTIDTNNRVLPPDLMSVPFDSPLMRTRFEALLKAAAVKMIPDPRWVMLGNEVDVYLGQHENELEPYARFVENGRVTLRALRPALAVGVTTTHDGARDRPAMVNRLNSNMDVVSMTYYPIGNSFRVRPVSGLAVDFARMIRAAGAKPLFLQEFGCPADPSISSEDIQAEYVEGLFDQLSKYGDKIVGANWFLYCDFNDQLLSQFVKYYRVPDAGFHAYLSSLGLKRADGTARKSWQVFRQRVRSMPSH